MGDRVNEDDGAGGCDRRWALVLPPVVVEVPLLWCDDVEDR